MASYMYEAIEDAVRYPLEVEIDFWHRFMGWVPRVPDRPIRRPTDHERKGSLADVAPPATRTPFTNQARSMGNRRA